MQIETPLAIREVCMLFPHSGFYEVLEFHDIGHNSSAANHVISKL